jgi:hypothetical protein
MIRDTVNINRIITWTTEKIHPHVVKRDDRRFPAVCLIAHRFEGLFDSFYQDEFAL